MSKRVTIDDSWTTPFGNKQFQKMRRDILKSKNVASSTKKLLENLAKPSPDYCRRCDGDRIVEEGGGFIFDPVLVPCPKCNKNNHRKVKIVN